MRARAVIGANFGDEGKGLVTDYLCATQGADVVVRFNGGVNAGHTVVTPDGRRHVFSHFGSGTLAGVPTFLSQFFVCNPIIFLTEVQEIIDLGVSTVVWAHPDCLVTTFADIIINQELERKKGDKRHGSTGYGINETMNRSKIPHLKITMSDIWNRVDLRDKLKEICTKFAEFRTGRPLSNYEEGIEKFIQCCDQMGELVTHGGIGMFKDPIFEGAQGLLLDMDNKEHFPHVTHSKTGLHNVRVLSELGGYSTIEAYYVTRSYLTRHGAGRLPGESSALNFRDETNAPNEFQGTLRFAALDVASLFERIRDDCKNDVQKIVVTHHDQFKSPFTPDIMFNGPTRENVV